MAYFGDFRLRVTIILVWFSIILPWYTVALQLPENSLSKERSDVLIDKRVENKIPPNQPVRYYSNKELNLIWLACNDLISPNVLKQNDFVIFVGNSGGYVEKEKGRI